VYAARPGDFITIFNSGDDVFVIDDLRFYISQIKVGAAILTYLKQKNYEIINEKIRANRSICFRVYVRYVCQRSFCANGEQHRGVEHYNVLSY
jgi:hypothetical protein